jgi:hypothetical protein
LSSPEPQILNSAQIKNRHVDRVGHVVLMQESFSILLFWRVMVSNIVIFPFLSRKFICRQRVVVINVFI